jgi:hypothetical protein
MDCWLVAFENVSYKTICEHTIFVLLHRSPSGTLQMHEEAYDKSSLKKTQVFLKWYKYFHDDPCSRLDVFLHAQCFIRYELIPEGHTVDKKIYVEIHHHIRDAMRRKCPEKWK